MKRKVAAAGRRKQVIFVEYVRLTGRKVFTVTDSVLLGFSGICPAQMLMGRMNSAFFRKTKKHTERCCGDACLAKTRPAVATLHYYMGRRQTGEI